MRGSQNKPVPITMALPYELQVLLFLFVCNSVVNSQDHVCDPKQSLALLQFKNAFSHNSYEYGSDGTSTWNESTDCCSWDGVECDEEGEGHVVGLHLGSSFLSGTLHPNSTLFTLSHLQTFNLSNNHFSGSPFSPQFGMLWIFPTVPSKGTFPYKYLTCLNWFPFIFLLITISVFQTLL